MSTIYVFISVINFTPYLRLIFMFLDAANDVHSSMEVYQKLCDIAQLNAITLDDKKSDFTSDVTIPTSEKYL